VAAAYGSSANGVQTATSDTTVVITKPTGLAAGDLMIATLGCADSRTISPPGTWDTLHNDSDGGQRVYVFARIADAGDAAATNFTFTVSGTFGASAGAMYRVTGGSDADIDITISNGSNSQTLEVPDANAVSNDSLAIWCGYQGQPAGPATISSGSEREDNENATASCWIYGATADVASSGTVAGPTITKTGFGAGRGFAIIIPPSGGGGGGTTMAASHYYNAA
jgi:hypothetical protein